MSLLYSSFDYIYETYQGAYIWLYEWMNTYVYGNYQGPKLTYTRCFGCHTADVIDPNTSINNIKSKYCHSCYEKLLRDAMDSIITNMI